MSDMITPREFVEQLDRHIIGQEDAKKAIAVAVRNRYRRQKLTDELKDEVIPKNILMIGPTGVGKTELARRIAKIIKAPFVKVEATKFTEVGYVGRNVESMVKDLVAEAVHLVEEEKRTEVSEKAKKHAENKLVDLLIAKEKQTQSSKGDPFESPVTTDADEETSHVHDEKQAVRSRRREIRHKLSQGLLEDVRVKIEIEERDSDQANHLGKEFEDMGINFQDIFGKLFPKKKTEKQVPVREARKILQREEAQKLINEDQVQQEAIERAENYGIIFLDEFDKIVDSQNHSSGPDVSREGVQRDILPIVEGSSVSTKYGRIKTDYIMFIGAGAFHSTKPSDLIPELQGRFPIRVKLDSLTKDDFYRILTEPEHALLNQYKGLLGTEEVDVTFTDEAIWEIAVMAESVNANTDDIGARRLHTLLERLLEELSFYAPEMKGQRVEITKAYVQEQLQDIVTEENVSRFIL